MNAKQKLAAIVAAVKNGDEVPEWAVPHGGQPSTPHASRTQVREECLKSQEPPVNLQENTKIYPGDQGIRVLENISSNQGDLESLLRQLNVKPAEAAMLFERYGDVIDIISKHPVFQRITKDRKDGGWGVYPQALTLAVKNHALEGDLTMGLAIVVAAVREVLNYRAAKAPRKLLFHILAERYPRANNYAGYQSTERDRTSRL